MFDQLHNFQAADKAMLWVGLEPFGILIQNMLNDVLLFYTKGIRVFLLTFASKSMHLRIVLQHQVETVLGEFSVTVGQYNVKIYEASAILVF